MTDESTDETEYLVVVDYDDEAERKRAEYLLDNWDDGETRRVKGLTRKAVGVDVEELYDQLAAKVPPGNVSAFELHPVDAEATAEQATIHRTFRETNPERLEWAMETIMNKRKAVQQGSTDDGREIWAVYTKKGRAEISYEIKRAGAEMELHVVVDGFGEAPSFLKEYITDELQYMID